MKKAELTGKKFNKLLVVRETSSTRKGMTYWECLCDCGTIKIYSVCHLTRKKNPVKSCGCFKRRSGKDHKDWTGFGEISGNWWNLHITRELKVGNNRHRVSVTISIKEAWNLFETQNRQCALSGIPIYFGKGNGENTASLDRIDSSKGYDLSNVQWVHKHINFMKRDFEQNYFIDLCKKIVDNKK